MCAEGMEGDQSNEMGYAVTENVFAECILINNRN